MKLYVIKRDNQINLENFCCDAKMILRNETIPHMQNGFSFFSIYLEYSIFIQKFDDKEHLYLIVFKKNFF